MAPGSDVDLLFLLPYKQTAWSESVVEAMLYVLWDLKLKVGHATRSVDDCIREAKADMTIRTSLLEARFLFGEQSLFDDAGDPLRQGDRARTRRPNSSMRSSSERDARVAKAGASRYLVEPNVKDGKGGLRDLNTLFWIAKYVYRVRTPEELVSGGALHGGGVQAVRALRGIPVAGALPPAFRDRPGRGAAHLRPAAPDRRAPRRHRARRPVGGRALHEGATS